jgi:hypothetical protein
MAKEASRAAKQTSSNRMEKWRNFGFTVTITLSRNLDLTAQTPYARTKSFDFSVRPFYGAS